MYKRQFHVLVVDDDRIALYRIVRVLEQRDYIVLGAPTREQAKLWLAEWPVDLMVAGVRLPGIGGLQFFRAAKARNTELAGVLIGKEGDQKLETDAWRYGAALLLAPFDDQHLLTVVAERLASIRRRQRWPRKMVAGRVAMTVGGAPAALVDVSYGGLRFAVRREVYDLPSPIPIEFPGARLRVDAELVWSARGADGESSVCGAAILEHTPPADWRKFVDRIPQHA
jgi:CheY-like chemotaxis protein